MKLSEVTKRYKELVSKKDTGSTYYRVKVRHESGHDVFCHPQSRSVTKRFNQEDEVEIYMDDFSNRTSRTT